MAEVKATASVQPYEKEFFRKDGSRVPVLVGAALFKEGGTEGVAFVLDLSEQTIRSYRKSLMRKLGVNNAVTLTQLAYSTGLTQVSREEPPRVEPPLAASATHR